MTFLERLHRSALYAGIPFNQSAIAQALGIKRQTVYKWFNGTVPETPMIANIATAWRVDPIWLATGVGAMIPAPGSSLTDEERELLRCYRNATPTRRKALYDIARSLGKAIVVVALTIPAFTPERDSRGGPPFNIILSTLHIVQFWIFGRWIAYILGVRKRTHLGGITVPVTANCQLS